VSGPPGPQGPPGAAGAAGERGAPADEPDGPQRFAGLTSKPYNGNLGGLIGANTKCAADFPGSHFCGTLEYDRATLPANAAGETAYLDGRVNNSPACNEWTSEAISVRATGVDTKTGLFLNGGVDGNFACNQTLKLACCFGRPKASVVGYSPPSPGVMGGRAGAHSICSNAFAGSHFCSDLEFKAGYPTVNGTGLAFVDTVKPPSLSEAGIRGDVDFDPTKSTTCRGWTAATALPSNGGNPVALEGLTVDRVTGVIAKNPQAGCAKSLPLACCK
jgi:hypothetical protein